MADDFFKVRNGFIVGEDKFTVDGTSGDVEVTGDLTVAGGITFTGDLAVNGGDITTTSTTATVFNTTATTVNIGSAATTMSIGNGAGTVTIPGNLTVNGTTTTINTQDLLVEDKNITIGNVAIPTDITASGGGITLLGDTNKTITWNNSTDGWEFNQPIKVTGNLVLTGNISDTGALQISTGANGDITLAPNGTGNVALTLGNGGNLTNTRNYVLGTIRQTAAATAGDIWGFGTGTSSPVRGIYLDNSATSTTVTGKRNAVVMRNTGNAPRNSIIGEVGRGTNPSSPTVVTAGTNLVEMAGGGYYGGGSDSGWTTGNGFGNAGSIRLNAGETWSSTNTGVNFTVLGSGIGAYAAVAPQILMQLSSNAGAFACDNPTFLTKAVAIGGTGKYMLDIFESRVDVGGQTLKINSRQEAGDSVIQAYDSTSLGTLTWDGTNWIVSSDLQINGNDILASDGATNITLTSNTLTTVAGDLKVGGNDIQASDGTTALTLSASTGNVAVVGNLDVLGGTITESTGALTISTGAANGNITLDPNGTGNVVLTFANGGNLTNDRNYVSGNIRQTAAASAGDIYGLGTGTTTPYRGISLDNYATATTTTGKRTGIALRNYGAPPRNTIFGEVARGTNPSSPLAPLSGIPLIEMAGGGYYGGGAGDGWVSSTTAGVAGVIRLTTTENWSTTNTGTGFSVLGSPTGAYAGTTLSLLDINSNTASYVSDSQTFRTKPAAAGGTNFSMLTLTESLVTVGGDLRVNGNDIQASDGATNITLTGNTLTSFAGDLRINGNDIQNSAGQTSYAMTSDRSNTSINTTAMNFNTTSGSNMVNFTASGSQGGFTFSDPNGSGNNVLMEFGATKSVYALYGVSADGSVTPTVNYNGYRRVAGNNVATKTNDRLGQFTFNGNINTGTGGPSSNVVGGEIRVYATEDWDNTKAGTGIALEITKQGTNTNTNVFLSSANQTEVTGDTIILKDTSGENLAQLTAANSAITTDRLDVRGSTVDSPYMVLFKDGGNDVVLGLSQTRATAGYENAVFNFTTQRSADGINYTPTQNGDILGEYKFNGNAYTSTTPGTAGPTAFINVSATENWTNTAQGSRFNFSANRTGGTTAYTVIQGTPDQLDLQAATINLNSYTGTALTSASIGYTRTYGEFAYVNAAGFDIPAQNTIYTMPLDTTLNAQGTSISGTGNININVSGWYKIIMSLQATSSHNGVNSFVFWLRKNGSDVANSKTEVDFLKDQKSVIAMDWLVNSDGNDYWEIVYATANAAYADIAFPTIAATTTPFVSPVAPAVIFNVIPIGA